MALRTGQRADANRQALGDRRTPRASTRSSRTGVGAAASAAIGFCFGETTSLFAMGAGCDMDGFHQAVIDSGIFTREICGELRDGAARVEAGPADPAGRAGGAGERSGAAQLIETEPRCTWRSSTRRAASRSRATPTAAIASCRAQRTARAHSTTTYRFTAQRRRRSSTAGAGCIIDRRARSLASASTRTRRTIPTR